MSPEERIQRVQREMFFRVLSATRPPPAVAQALARAIHETHYTAGATLFRIGEEADDIYFIGEGEVVLEAPDEEPWTFKKGDVVGILDVNMARRRTRGATAVTDVVAMVLRAEDWLEIIEDNFEYALSTRRYLGNDLYRMGQELLPSSAFDPPAPHDEDMRPPEMSPVANLVVLMNMNALGGASVQALSLLAAAAEVRELEAGDTVLEPGTAADSIHFVVWGIVDIEHVGPPTMHAAFGAGSLLGGAFAFGEALQQFRARARTDVVLLRIRLTDLDDIAEDHFDVTRALMRYLAVFRERVMRLRSQLGRERRSARPPTPDSMGPTSHHEVP